MMFVVMSEMRSEPIPSIIITVFTVDNQAAFPGGGSLDRVDDKVREDLADRAAACGRTVGGLPEMCFVRLVQVSEEFVGLVCLVCVNVSDDYLHEVSHQVSAVFRPFHRALAKRAGVDVERDITINIDVNEVEVGLCAACAEKN